MESVLESHRSRVSRWNHRSSESDWKRPRYTSWFVHGAASPPCRPTGTSCLRRARGGCRPCRRGRPCPCRAAPSPFQQTGAILPFVSDEGTTGRFQTHLDLGTDLETSNVLDCAVYAGFPEHSRYVPSRASRTTSPTRSQKPDVEFSIAETLSLDAARSRRSPWRRPSAAPTAISKNTRHFSHTFLNAARLSTRTYFA